MIYYPDKDESAKEDGFGFPVGRQAQCFVNSRTFVLKTPFTEQHRSNIPKKEVGFFPEVGPDEQQLASVLESARDRGRPICGNCSLITGGQC